MQRKLYTADSPIVIAHLRNILATTGIASEIRNDRLIGALGEIPFIECWPELWVAARDYERARQLIETALLEPAERATWRCAGCGELIEAQFEICWNCAAEARPS